MLHDGEVVELRELPVSQLLKVSLAASCRGRLGARRVPEGADPAVCSSRTSGRPSSASMDPSLNAIGVEACLREMHNTLSGSRCGDLPA